VEVSERLGMDGDGLHRRRLLRHLNLLAVTAPLPYISSQASSNEARRDEATGGAGARVGQRMCSFKHLPPQGDGNQRTGYLKFNCKENKIQLDFKNLFFKIKINVAVLF